MYRLYERDQPELAPELDQPRRLRRSRVTEPAYISEPTRVHGSATVGTHAELPHATADDVPDRPVNAGNSRSLPENPVHQLTCEPAG